MIIHITTICLIMTQKKEEKKKKTLKKKHKIVALALSKIAVNLCTSVYF